MLMWGGGSVAAARRAGRYGLGMLGNANVEGMHEAYQAGVPRARPRAGPIFLPDREKPVCLLRRRRRRQGVGRDRRVPAARRARVRRLEPRQRLLRGLLRRETVEELRANPTSHRIYSVSEAVTRVRSGEVLNLSPLCGGVPPEIAWPYLKRVGDVVMSEVAR